MDTTQSIILALIQGITEFLPVSSSAHLILPSQVLGWPDQGLAFDIAVHLGSLFAVVIYFRQTLLDLTIGTASAVFQQRYTEQLRLVLQLAVATLPAVVVGLLAKDIIEEQLRSLWVIAATTIIFGLLLAVADRRHAHETAHDVTLTLSWTQAIVIGLAQAIALIPGTSRSGITITAALLMGINRQLSARFSFLLAIPTIAGAALLQILDLLSSEGAVDWRMLGIATAASFVAAYACITLFLGWIERIGMMPFVIYRLLLGVVLVAIGLTIL